jgi:hypothetical protein
VHGAKDRGVGADPEGERQDDNERKRRATSQRAQRIPEVEQDRFDHGRLKDGRFEAARQAISGVLSLNTDERSVREGRWRIGRRLSTR